MEKRTEKKDRRNCAKRDGRTTCKDDKIEIHPKIRKTRICEGIQNGEIMQMRLNMTELKANFKGKYDYTKCPA